MMFFVLLRAWGKEKILSPYEKSNLRPSDSLQKDSKASGRGIRRFEVRFLVGTQNIFYYLPHARDKTKNIFLYVATCLYGPN